ncbi:MAG: hypothetical protein QF886_06715 [Planctomycetota bacterium]|nr:hypothetical protein [Planctomycetota bacterium]
MGQIANLSVNWDNLTSVTQARSKQAQANLQAAISRGSPARNYGPQSQASTQNDESHSLADATVHIPRSGSGDYDGTAVFDVSVHGRKLHALNDNINEQSQSLQQDAINDSPLVDAFIYEGYLESEYAGNTRPGANNLADQHQGNNQTKKSIAASRTRLIELGGHNDVYRKGSLIDVADIRSRTTAFNDQRQNLKQNSILNDQGYQQYGILGASNLGSQTADSTDDLVTHSLVEVTAPLNEYNSDSAIGTGTFFGGFQDITSEGISGNFQFSEGSQVAVDANFSGGNGEAFNVMPQAQWNTQNQDTRSTLEVNPRSFPSRDTAVSALNVNATTANDNEQIQVGSQVSEVAGFGAASNTGPAEQANVQKSVTVASVNFVF